MKTSKMWLLAILFLAFAAVSCDDDEDDPVNEAQVLVEFLEGADGGYANTIMPAIMKADGVKGLMAVADGVYIIDIRSSDSWTAGHIEGAINVPAADVLSHLDGMDAASYEKIAIVCYSGQSAAWVTCLAQISGYDNVFSMKWGMTSWNAEFDSWSGNVNNTYSALFKTEDYPKGAEGDLPGLVTGETEGEDILAARLDVVLAEGFGGAAITAAAVYENLDGYYIVNYWPAGHYEDPGHIEGAMQYTPKESIALDLDLTTLPTDKTIVVYCYSGQTSANMAAYLRVLGYDALSLKFGANAMIYDNMPAGKWSDTEIFGYDYVAPEPTK